MILPRKSVIMQPLNKLLEILHKFVSLIFLKIVTLKAASYSRLISNFKHPPAKEFFQEQSFADILQNRCS